MIPAFVTCALSLWNESGMTRQKGGVDYDNLPIVYLTYVVVCTIGFSILGSISLYLWVGCWPLSSSGFAPCLSSVVPDHIVLLPAVLGIAAGTFLGWRTTRRRRR